MSRPNPTGGTGEVSSRRWLPWRATARAAESVEPGTDALTGLGHRPALVERGAAVLGEARRTGRIAAVLVFDLDAFKSINDTLGHAAGDRVLREVGSRISACLHPGEVAVRTGGDEFAALLGPFAGPEVLDERIGELRDTLGAPIRVDDLRLSVGISVGSAVYGLDGTRLDDLLRAADQAMYSAKAAGSGQWRRSAGPPSDDDDVRRVTEELRRAVERNELVVHYQPQVEAWSGEVTGFEALVRWEHPRHGLLLPGQFIPLAERTGSAAMITMFTLEQALADHAKLARLTPRCSVSVNVSARSMMGDGLVRDLEAVLARCGVPPGNLTLEITEPSPHPTPDLLDLFAGLRRLGCRVSVHGYGSAQSSITGLWHYSVVREVKIDPGIIQALGEDAEVERLVRAMVGGAHGLDVRVIAEGVESRLAAQRLRSIGCDGLQGHWIGVPAPLDELERWLEAWPRLRAGRLGI